MEDGASHTEKMDVNHRLAGMWEIGYSPQPKRSFPVRLATLEGTSKGRVHTLCGILCVCGSGVSPESSWAIAVSSGSVCQIYRLGVNRSVCQTYLYGPLLMIQYCWGCFAVLGAVEVLSVASEYREGI